MKGGFEEMQSCPRMQLFDDNYLGRLEACSGRVREAELPLSLRDKSKVSGMRCLSTKLSAFLNGHRHFFWQLQMLPRRVQPHLFDVLPVARLP